MTFNPRPKRGDSPSARIFLFLAGAILGFLAGGAVGIFSYMALVTDGGRRRGFSPVAKWAQRLSCGEIAAIVIGGAVLGAVVGLVLAWKADRAAHKQ